MEYIYPEGGTPDNNKTLKIVLIAVMAFMCVLMIVAVILIITFRYDDSNSKKKGTDPVITITSCPQQLVATSPTAVVKGVITDKETTCTLTINGETVASSKNAGEQAKWEKSYTLSPGQSMDLSFEVKDEDGNVVKESRSISCATAQNQSTTTTTTTTPTTITSYPSYAQGTQLVKNTAYSNSYVNVRSGPGTGYSVVGTISGGQRATYISNYGNGWYYVQAPNGNRGYVSAAYVKVASSSSSSTTYSSGSLYSGCSLVKNTAQANGYVNVRSGPGTGYSVVGTIKGSQRATFISNYGNGWYYVQAPNGNRGYVSSAYVRVAY